MPEKHKGHIGVSWWEGSEGHWHVAACNLGDSSHSQDVEGTEQDARKVAFRMLELAVEDAAKMP